MILAGLFLVQYSGTARVGAMFGPVMIVWFVTIGILGLRWIVEIPGVLAAVNPVHAIEFFAANGYHGFVVLGAVFLVVTGGEALYADMGHFGAGPIRLAWFGLVMPGLILNYFGQGAILIANPETAESPFYHLAPAPLVLPLVILATASATIASQALISAVFSLTRQAVQLGYSPRVEIRHTSATTIGQIYVPTVNWLLAIATITLVLTFQSSSALAAAYGIAVTATMAITTLLAYVVARQVWHWSRWAAGSVTAIFVDRRPGVLRGQRIESPARRLGADRPGIGGRICCSRPGRRADRFWACACASARIRSISFRRTCCGSGLTACLARRFS